MPGAITVRLCVMTVRMGQFSPEASKALTLPAEHGFALDEDESRAPILPHKRNAGPDQRSKRVRRGRLRFRRYAAS